MRSVVPLARLEWRGYVYPKDGPMYRHVHMRCGYVLRCAVFCRVQNPFTVSLKPGYALRLMCFIARLEASETFPADCIIVSNFVGHSFGFSLSGNRLYFDLSPPHFHTYT